ncbi:MAG: hypothetical protein GC155_09790 [Alphaproteobacteria bacterium]|nr:hypothetical protein [Alphaproteobacteria bacterium]
MVTYRQVGRSIMRTARAIDRDAKRAQRQRLAYEKAAQKQALLEASADAAQEYSQFVDSLTGAHRTAFQRLDWFTIAAREPLPPPVRANDEETRAREKAAAFKPSWVDKAMGLEKGKRKKLDEEIANAISRDNATFESLLANAQRQNDEIKFAQDLIARDQATIEQALTTRSQLGNLPFCVEGLDLLFTDDSRVIAMIDGLDFEDMPEQSVGLLQSGKASIKQLTRGKALELHRDNICASAVRVALEILMVLPIDEVEVVMHTDLLNAATGHIESEPVLYLRVAAQAIASLNLSRTEAAALVERLGGHSNWTKRDGFRGINLGAFNITVGSAGD